MPDSAVPETNKRKVWAVKIGDGTVQLQDLAYKDVAAVADRHGYVVSPLYESPVLVERAWFDIVYLCAIKLGVGVPCEPPETWREYQKVWAHFDQVDDDFPTSWDEQENGPAVPPAADRTT